MNCCHYVSFYRNKTNADAIRRTVLTFYSPNDTYQSKRTLKGQFSLLLSSCAFVAERRNSSTRAAHEAEVDDILNIFDVLDLQNILVNCKFVASNLDNIPKFGPEEVNLASIVERQLRTEATVTDMVSAVEQIATDRSGITCNPDIEATTRLVVELQQKLETFSSSVWARIDHLSTVCSSLNTTSSSSSSRQPTRQLDDIDHKSNLIIFGVQEDRDI